MIATAMPIKEPESQHKIPYLDGLRGYSIITVVMLHALSASPLPPWLDPVMGMIGNGRLGVTIFFSISGFLITTLLLREQDRTGTISLRGFYERRIARIFPAAYVYIGAMAILSLIGVLHLRWGVFLGASLFCWNYGAILNLFAGSSDYVVLAHFWSVSLEEQFYLFWPGCLLLLGRARSRKIAWVAVAVLPFVRIVSYALFPKSHDQLSAMFHTAVDQILWGALAALAYATGTHLRWARNRWFGWLTLVWSIMTFFVISWFATWVPGVTRFVLPTVYSSFSALLLLWLLSGSTGFVRAILEWQPLRWVGLIS